MTEGDASTRLTDAIGFETLTTSWPAFITLELPLPAGHAVKQSVSRLGAPGSQRKAYQPVRDLAIMFCVLAIL